MTAIAGCDLKPLDADACHRWLESVTAADTQGNDDLVWLLGHCDDGVVWGRRDRVRWRLSSEVFPGSSPLPGRDNLQMLRLFGPFREVLLWRVEDGFLGRELSDKEGSTEGTLRPQAEEYILVGDRVQMAPREGFTLVADARGARHPVPLVCPEAAFGTPEKRRGPLRLEVRHYFTADPETGLVRVAASRLVHVKHV
jgi:CRISPR-associated protein (TIGR03984 family)